jgi:PAS domain S-box-containing protein
MTHTTSAGTESRSRVEPVGWSALKHLVEEQDRPRLVLFLEGQSRLLEMVARSAPLAAVLDELMRVLEQQVDGMVCSVHLLSEDRQHLRHCAAPSLPESLKRALDGSAIGPRAGSSGTAAFLSCAVIVTDIEHDPLWAEHKALALEAGLKACWATPILSGQGDVLGTLAMYQRQASAPSSMHLGMIDLATNLARIAIEHELAERERERLWDAKRFADRYLMVLRATNEAVWEWDLDGGGGYWNDGLSAFGYELGLRERTLDWWTAHIHPEEVGRVRYALESALDSGVSQWEEECRFRRNDGTYAHVVVHGLIIRNEAGKAVRMVGALQDITKRKRHEQELEQVAERLRSATAAGAIGTWRLDLRTEQFQVDPSLNYLINRKDEEIVEPLGDALRLVHSEDRTRLLQALDDSIATGRTVQIEHRIVLADGEIRWVRSSGRVLFDAEGGPAVVTGAVADITELKHAEQSMALLADASRLLAESLDTEQILSSMTRMAVPAFADAVLVVLRDPQTDELRVAATNAADPELLAVLRQMAVSPVPLGAAARRILQSGRAEYHPRLTAEWFHAEEIPEIFASLVRRFRISSLMQIPIALRSEPIGVIAFAATGTRVYGDNDLVFAEELGRRASHAMHNAELFQTATLERLRAQEAAELRERLLAIVGHDLRNPLSAISMAAQILSRSEMGSPSESLVYRIQASARRMTRMIAQVLDFARIRAGMSFELEFQPVDLHQLCNAVVEELRLSKPDQQIDVEFVGRGEVSCDADRIAQALSNLIGNAIQHGTQGPVSVTVSDAAADTVAVEVHNTGPPIPASVQASIFEAFRRESDTTGPDSKSIGLGLFIANEIVRGHGGSIGVVSPDRDGTTFTVVLPRRPAVSAESEAPSATPAPGP